MTKSKTLKSPAATSKIIRHIGLDVHKDSLAVAVAEAGGEPYYWKTISPDLHAVERLVAELLEGGKYQLRVLRSRADGVRVGAAIVGVGHRMSGNCPLEDPEELRGQDQDG